MNQLTETESICVKCNSQVKKKEIKPEHCDINTQSLLLMFRKNELIIIECPVCGSQGYIFNS